MVVSKNTAQQIAEILNEYLDEPTAEEIIFRLLRVTGNKSFTDTIRLVDKEYYNLVGE